MKNPDILDRLTYSRFSKFIPKFFEKSRQKNWLRTCRSLVGNWKTPLIIDVGAHIGQTAKQLKSWFPKGSIECFEPSPSSYIKLQVNTKSEPDINCHNLALGKSSGFLELIERDHSDMNSFLEVDSQGWGQFLNKTSVEVITLDQFFSEKEISNVSILKLDTQGYDLEVLKGANSALEEKRIELIYTEVNFAPIYKGQAEFDEIYKFLREKSYRLIDFYEIYRHSIYAGWGNALFRLE